MQTLIIISVVIIFFITAWMCKKQLVKVLLKLKGKLHIQSLRTAINDADADKEKTDRKNLVVFNTSTGEFEPVQKRMLKGIAKMKSQNKVPAGFRQPKAVKKSALTLQKVKHVENKSLYVTK